MNTETTRSKLDSLRAQLHSERSSFISHWRDLGDYILTRRSRFVLSDVNRGEPKNQNIIDSSATMSARTLRSGMMSGVTSPSRPWFRLQTPDQELNEVESVKEWLHDVTQRMQSIFIRSNLYNVLPIVYGDMGVFGTAALYMEEDFDGVVRFKSLPIGSFMIMTDSKDRVRGIFREFRSTVRQVVEEFGRTENGTINWDNISAEVKTAWESNQGEMWVDVCHVIKANDEYDPNKLESKFKKYLSYYYEKGSSQLTSGSASQSANKEEKYLRQSGYDLFPVLCPRWEVTGEDVYGTECPGMVALGDIKALQLMQKKKLKALNKMVDPPMKAPSSLRNKGASILPGDITYYDDTSGKNGFSPVHEVNPDIKALLLDIQDHQQRIQKAFYADLFLMLANSDRRQITATEINERHEEKLLALGPVLEQINQDLLDPLIDNTFDIMIRQRLIPDPPQELEGVDLKVEYISIMAQAQKLVGLASIERFAGFAGEIVANSPESADKIDTDKLLDIYAEMTSVPPGIVRPDEKVAEIRQQRAQAQQAQQASEMIAQGATVAKDLSQANLGDDNALNALITQSKAGQLVPT